MKKPVNEIFLTPNQIYARKLLPFGQRAIYRLIKEGKLRAIITGGGAKQERYKIHIGEIESYLKSIAHGRKH
jgi:hypothetical protein